MQHKELPIKACLIKTSSKPTIFSIEIDPLSKAVLAACNNYVEQLGIPLAAHRKF